LRFEIASRERRIHRLEVQLTDARQGELAQLERRRQQLELDLQAERDAIKRASDRLKELEQGGGRPAAPKPTKPGATQPPPEPQP
jgi:chromosome segregation ATPase